jgi:hypothetical protein
VKKKPFLVLGGMIFTSAVLVLTLLQVRSVHSRPQASIPTPNALIPVDDSLLPVMPTGIQPEIVDLAPHIPYEDKPSVVVQHADGSLERYLLAPDTLDAFIENLPKEDKFLGDIPAPSFLAGSGEPATPES